VLALTLRFEDDCELTSLEDPFLTPVCASGCELALVWNFRVELAEEKTESSALAAFVVVSAFFLEPSAIKLLLPDSKFFLTGFAFVLLIFVCNWVNFSFVLSFLP